MGVEGEARNKSRGMRVSENKEIKELMETGVYLLIKTIGQAKENGRNAVKKSNQKEIEMVKESDMLRGEKRVGKNRICVHKTMSARDLYSRLEVRNAENGAGRISFQNEAADRKFTMTRVLDWLFPCRWGLAFASSFIKVSVHYPIPPSFIFFFILFRFHCISPPHTCYYFSCCFWS